jgi:hypothetical protein
MMYFLAFFLGLWIGAAMMKPADSPYKDLPSRYTVSKDGT